MAKTNSFFIVGLTCLGFICFGLASAAVGIPIWGHFQSLGGGYMEENGYFGPWRVCKYLSYYREKCGTDISKFQPSMTVFASGVLASFSATALAVYSLLSVIQIAMVASQESILMKYKTLVLLKMIIGLTACVLAIISAALFAVQMDESHRSGYIITRGVSFYLQIIVIVLTLCLFALTIYDVIKSRKSGGDPTMLTNQSTNTSAITINNPGFKDSRRRKNFKSGISVTDASGRPYDDIKNGSVISVDTTLTSISNSTLESVTRSPLRSSLKKPRPPGELGIRNPGFANHEGSPSSMRRNGSMKKVRINVHSTDV